MRIAVIGLGHIGSWLMSVLSQTHDVVGFDKDRTRTAAESGSSLLHTVSDLRSYNPELLINAVSLQNTIEAFEEVTPFIQESCIICDVASVKGRIADYYTSSPFPFVSVHPMFGPTYANMGHVKGENAVIIRESWEVGKTFFTTLFESQGVRIYCYSFDDHDRMMAYSLTTPFVSSLVFAACINSQAVPGTTFSRHMDLARNLLSEDDHLLAEILFNPYSVAELNKITARLEFLKHVIAARDGQEAFDFFRNLRLNIGSSDPKDT